MSLMWLPVGNITTSVAAVTLEMLAKTCHKFDAQHSGGGGKKKINTAWRGRADIIILSNKLKYFVNTGNMRAYLT